jgi:arsenite methyltransferase
MTLAPEEVKACCAAVYSSEAARLLLGDSFHPGGAALTYRLAAELAVGPGDLVVDVACGPGSSAVRVAEETGCDVVGVDLSPPDPVGHPRVRFLRGDAEALPLPDAVADGVLCECALCTFPDKQAAARELARILRPDGRLALSDVVAEPELLPAELTGRAAWIACIGDARPLDEIVVLLEGAGFAVEQTERVDGALEELAERVEARLRAARLLVSGLDVGRALELVAAAREAIAAGALGYAVVVARRATASRTRSSGRRP